MLLDDPEELGFFVPKKLANAESLAGFLDDELLELLELELLGFLQLDELDELGFLQLDDEP